MKQALRLVMWMAIGWMIVSFAPAQDGEVASRQLAFHDGFRAGYSLGYAQGQEDHQRGVELRAETRMPRETDKALSALPMADPDHERGFRSGYRPGYVDGYVGYSFRPDHLFTLAGETGGECSQVRGECRPVQLIGNSGEGGCTVFGVGWQCGYVRGLQQGRQDYNADHADGKSETIVQRQADTCFHPEYGDKEQFSLGFQQGFQKGYQNVFGRYHTGDPCEEETRDKLAQR
jgi:hypothetical protein